MLVPGLIKSALNLDQKSYLYHHPYPLLLDTLEHTLPSDPAGEGVGLTLFPFAAPTCWAMALGETPCWWLEGFDEACCMHFLIAF